jgi:NDP-sugar pyrophosphorylase family protein
LLDYIIRLFRGHGITEIAINLHYKPETIKNHLENGERFGARITYSFEETLLGTAGALSRLRDFFKETFIAINGDMLTNINLTALADFHRSKKATATIALFRVDDPTTRGMVELDKEWRILRFVEKPPPEQVFSDLANAGVYVLEPEVLKYIPENTFADLGQDTFPKLLNNGALLFGYPSNDYLLDIGTMESYQRAEQDIIQGKFRGFSQKDFES